MHVICDFVHKFTEVLVSCLGMLSPFWFFIIFSLGASHLLMNFSLPLAILFLICFLFLVFSFGFLALTCLAFRTFFPWPLFPQFEDSEKARGILISKELILWLDIEVHSWMSSDTRSLQLLTLNQLPEYVECLKVPVRIYLYSSLLGGSLLGKADSSSLCKSLGLQPPALPWALWFTWLAFSSPWLPRGLSLSLWQLPDVYLYMTRPHSLWN